MESPVAIFLLLLLFMIEEYKISEMNLKKIFLICRKEVIFYANRPQHTNRLNGTFSSRENLNAAAAYHFPLINNVCESTLDGRLSLAKAFSIIFLNKVYY